MREKLNHIIHQLKQEVWIYFGIAFGMAFLIFIFKPFPLDHIDFDNRKLFNIGLGTILFLIILFVRVIFPCISKNNVQEKQSLEINSVVSLLLIWIINFIIIAIFIRFAGLVVFSYYLFFKVTLISAAPPVILSFYDKMNGLKQFNDTLIFKIELLQRKIGKYEVADLNHSVEFLSEKKEEIIHLLIVNILFFRAADNYVEIHFLEDEKERKKLIRNTLRNIELQVKPFKNFVRCHRNCIVNIDHIENVAAFCKDHTLIIKGHHDKIPVSRQFLLKIKEAL